MQIEKKNWNLATNLKTLLFWALCTPYSKLEEMSGFVGLFKSLRQRSTISLAINIWTITSYYLFDGHKFIYAFPLFSIILYVVNVQKPVLGLCGFCQMFLFSARRGLLFFKKGDWAYIWLRFCESCLQVEIKNTISLCFLQWKKKFGSAKKKRGK